MWLGDMDQPYHFYPVDSLLPRTLSKLRLDDSIALRLNAIVVNVGAAENAELKKPLKVTILRCQLLALIPFKSYLYQET